jgi:hypothetical protein
MFDLIKAPHDAQLIGFCDLAESRSPLFSLGTFLVNLTIVTDLAKVFENFIDNSCSLSEF